LRGQRAELLVVEQRSHDERTRLIATSNEWKDEFLLFPKMRNRHGREEPREVGKGRRCFRIVRVSSPPQPTRFDERVMMVVRERDKSSVSFHCAGGS
jgi:hypothetical protein